MDQAAIYAWCKAVLEEEIGSETGPASFHAASFHDTSFHRDSPSYLVSTEYPWIALNKADIRGRRVLTVAAGGELPLFFLAAGASRVVAVDISFHACAMNELKRAVLSAVNRSEFVRFFLGSIDACRSWLRQLHLAGGSDCDPVQRKLIYRQCRARLSAPAKDYWDRRIEGRSAAIHPFLHLLRSTDLSCPDLIPLLTDDEGYEAWRRSACAYPLINLPFHLCLERLDQRFDLIYCSNILEYLRTDYAVRDQLERYSACIAETTKLAGKRLTPGGLFIHYLFAHRESPFCRNFTGDLTEQAVDELESEIRPIRCDSPIFSGFRFRHTLAIFKKIS